MPINDAAPRNIETPEQEEAPEEEYTPPKTAWRLPVFVHASLSAVKRRIVDCPQCPVFLQCQEGEGGTGYVCAQCGNTAVWVDRPDFGSNIPKDVLILDCNKHKFETVGHKKLAKCSLCSGGIMQLEVLSRGARNWVVFTKHAGVSVEARHKSLKEAWERWKKWAKEEAEKAKK